MLEILYRIYEVADEETAQKNLDLSLNISQTQLLRKEQNNMDI